MKTYLSIALALGIAALTAPAVSAKSALAGKDEAFVKKAAQGGLLEVKLGELAKSKAVRVEVKEFGAMMASDHGKANSELKALAEQKGVALPDALDNKHDKTFDRLNKLSGEEFDREYVKEMVEDHEKDVKHFEEASKNAKDGDVKAFAERTLPTLKTHLERIKSIQGATN